MKLIFAAVLLTALSACAGEYTPAKGFEMTTAFDAPLRAGASTQATGQLETAGPSYALPWWAWIATDTTATTGTF